MCVLRYYVMKALTNEMNSRMCAKDVFSPLATSVRTEETRYHKLIGSCRDVIGYLLKNTQLTSRARRMMQQFPETYGHPT